MTTYDARHNEDHRITTVGPEDNIFEALGFPRDEAVALLREAQLRHERSLRRWMPPTRVQPQITA